jgi:hypothetical protein
MEQQCSMHKNIEIQYHNWRATCILATSTKAQFKFKLLHIGVDFRKYGAFRAQGITSWLRVNELFPKDLPKQGNGNNNIYWLNHLQLEWEYKSTQPTHITIVYYVTIEFVITCDYLSFATMFYHFYN